MSAENPADIVIEQFIAEEFATQSAGWGAAMSGVSVSLDVSATRVLIYPTTDGNVELCTSDDARSIHVCASITPEQAHQAAANLRQAASRALDQQIGGGSDE